MYVLAGTTTSSPAPISEGLERDLQRGGSGLDADAVARPCEPRELALEAIDLRSHNETRALQHFVDRGHDVGLDRRILRLEVYERNVHDRPLRGLRGATMRVCLLLTSRAATVTRLPATRRELSARILQQFPNGGSVAFPKSVLITGGAGFIGSHLVDDLLASGHRVTVFDNFSSGLRENLRTDEVEIVTGDVLDRDAIVAAARGKDVISHQAAQLEITKCLEDPIGDLRTNLIGTLNVLEAARLAGVERTINASSACIYGQAAAPPSVEEGPHDPNWSYGVSKLAAEKYAQVFSNDFGFPVFSLRYGIVYGPREWYGRVLTIFLKRALDGRPPVVFGAGDQLRDFVFVDDVVAVHRACMETALDRSAFVQRRNRNRDVDRRFSRARLRRHRNRRAARSRRRRARRTLGTGRRPHAPAGRTRRDASVARQDETASRRRSGNAAARRHRTRVELVARASPALGRDALLMMRMLISAGGTVTAQSLIKALREDGRASFVAVVDVDELNATKFFVDEFVRVPLAADPGFVGACLDAVRRLRIDLFVPIIVEREFLPLDGARAALAELGCTLAAPPRDVVLVAGDKLAVRCLPRTSRDRRRRRRSPTRATSRRFDFQPT